MRYKVADESLQVIRTLGGRFRKVPPTFRYETLLLQRFSIFAQLPDIAASLALKMLVFFLNFVTYTKEKAKREPLNLPSLCLIIYLFFSFDYSSLCAYSSFALTETADLRFQLRAYFSYNFAIFKIKLWLPVFLIHFVSYCSLCSASSAWEIYNEPVRMQVFSCI